MSYDSSRRSQSSKARGSTPSDALSFAQALLGIDASRTAGAEAGSTRDDLERLARISPRHEGRLRSLLEAEAEAVRRQATLDFVARILSVQEADWDPAKHPRGGYPENRGWFSPKSGSTSTPGLPHAGVSIASTRSRSPFQTASFSVDSKDADTLQRALADRGIGVGRSDAKGVTTFTLTSQPRRFAWDATGEDLRKAVLEAFLSSHQDLKYDSAAEFVEDIKLLENAAIYSRTKFKFLTGDPKLGKFFDENADLKPFVSPAAAIRDVYEHHGDVTMACRNCMQFAVLRSLLEVYGDKRFDEAVNSYRDPSKPFNILDQRLVGRDVGAFVKQTSASDPRDIIPGQWVYAPGNRHDGELPGYEGSNFIVQPGPYYRSPWSGGPTLPLGDHLVDTYLYRFRWQDKERDGRDRPSWSKWSNNNPEPDRRELVPIDRNGLGPVRLRDFLIRTPAESSKTIDVDGHDVHGILLSGRGTPRLLMNPNPRQRINRSN